MWRFSWVFMALLLLFASSLACRVVSRPSPTPLIMADTFFSGRAFVDSNSNGSLDAGDAPLANARFTAAGFGDLTDATGYAVIIIPGGWDKPVTARMSAPDGSGYTLISPAEVTLQSGLKTSADFLFASPLGVPTLESPTSESPTQVSTALGSPAPGSPTNRPSPPHLTINLPPR